MVGRVRDELEAQDNAARTAVSLVARCELAGLALPSGLRRGGVGVGETHVGRAEPAQAVCDGCASKGLTVMKKRLARRGAVLQKEGRGKRWEGKESWRNG